MKRLYAFDFDGTLTYKDSFIAFCIFAAGKFRFVLSLMRFFPELFGVALHLYSASRAKEKLFSYFFAGMPLWKFDEICGRFANQNRNFLRQDGMNAVKKACEDGTCMIVSASVSNWIRPFFKGLDITYITTNIEIDERNCLTGRFLGKNCKGAQKVRRITELFPERQSYTLIAYGDSGGDKELLDFADEAHFREFARFSLKSSKKSGGQNEL